MSATSGQFLTVPPLSHRSSHHHHRKESTRVSAQSPQPRVHPATRNVASSSRVKLENTPFGIGMAGDSSPNSPPAPPTGSRTSSGSTPSTTSAHTITTSSSSVSSSSLASSSSPTSPVVRRRRQIATTRLAPLGASSIIPATANSTAGSARSLSSSSQQQRQQSSQPPPPPSPPISPRSIFRAMPFLLRLRPPPSELFNMTYSSGEPRTHAVLKRPPICINKASSQALVYNKTLVCEDAVNAEVLLRLARNELLERARQTDRRVTALVDEEWRYTIRQTKHGDYNVQVFYSACPARCESQNSNESVDPRKPVALSHVTNIPGLMRVVHSE